MSIFCTCGAAIDPEEFACSVCGSDCLDILGSGSVTNPLYAETLLDPDPDNLATCEADGLLVELPVEITNPPRCQAYHNANQSLATDDLSVLALNSERYDWSVTAMHDTVTNNSRITMPVDGVYIVTLTGAFAANAAGDRAFYIRKNGREIIGGAERKPPSAAFESAMTVVVQEAFRSGEYVQALAKQDSGGALNVVVQRWSPVLTVQYRRRHPDD